MKTLTKEIWMDIPNRRQIISIHGQVEGLVRESGVQEGFVLVNAMHITASVFINDNEGGLHSDYEKWLETGIPERAVTRHYSKRVLSEVNRRLRTEDIDTGLIAADQGRVGTRRSTVVDLGITDEQVRVTDIDAPLIGDIIAGTEA